VRSGPLSGGGVGLGFCWACCSALESPGVAWRASRGVLIKLPSRSSGSAARRGQRAAWEGAPGWLAEPDWPLTWSGLPVT